MQILSQLLGLAQLKHLCGAGGRVYTQFVTATTSMSAAVKIPPLALPHSETGKPLELGPAIVSECALRISLSSPQVACS